MAPPPVKKNSISSLHFTLKPGKMQQILARFFPENTVEFCLRSLFHGESAGNIVKPFQKRKHFLRNIHKKFIRRRAQRTSFNRFFYHFFIIRSTVSASSGVLNAEAEKRSVPVSSVPTVRWASGAQ